MGKRLDDITREAIQRDAADGMKIGAIAQKHSVAWGTVQTIVGKKLKTKRQKKSRKSAAKSVNYRDVVADLRKKRAEHEIAIAKIDDVIDALITNLGEI